ncbi:hypothetical protein GCM10022267_90580 [Lentzea roselyniae]|uniref:Uncharacterized protein n=1 Tax=Lentzea roselyniae TaxID=531940 RepID=A0ABP7CIZ0_9PSEU
MRRGKSDDREFTGLTVVGAVFGSALFLPPLLNLVDQNETVGDIPAFILYLFAGWLCVITLAGLLVRFFG